MKMTKVAILGRTRWLIDAADRLANAGFQIVCVATAKAEAYYNCGPDSFRELARRHGADYLGIVSLSRDDVRARIAAADAEIAVSVNWPTRLNSRTISLFPLGIVNAHCGDLPRYRGNACPNWAILNGEERIGLCAHLMDAEEIDSGPVIARDFLPADGQTYIGDVYRWLDIRIPSLLEEAVRGLVSGNLQPVPQSTDPKLSLRCYPRRPEDSRIDWRQSAEQIHRLVRASSRPFQGAFAFLESGERVTIWRAEPSADLGPFCAIPGQVMFVDRGEPVIACGQGALRLQDVEIAHLSPDDAKAAIGRSLRARLQ